MATILATRHVGERINSWQLDVTFVRMVGGFDRSVVTLIKSVDPKHRAYNRRRKVWEIDTGEWRRIAAQLKWLGHTIIDRRCEDTSFVGHDHGAGVEQR